MKNDKVYARAIALLGELVELMERIRNAPDRLCSDYLPGKERRLLRRRAERLRNGETEPADKNLFSGPQLARLFEDTAAANEIREQTGPAFERNFAEMGRLTVEDGPAVRQAIEDFFLDARTQANQDGPGSEADLRYQDLQFFIGFAKSCRTDNRRHKLPDSHHPKPKEERKALVPLVPAEIIESAPPDAAVIPIPADGGDSGRGRMLLRIGRGEGSWIGSFECGSKTVSTVFMLPDHKHLFISADGAGYIVDAKSRTLVERTGTAVVGTMRDSLLTVFVVIHEHGAFEAFGKDGRLWKTAPVSDGPIRKVVLKEDEIVGVAWKSLLHGWRPFVVDIATGEVSLRLWG
jgi:hypothetical protein